MAILSRGARIAPYDCAGRIQLRRLPLQLLYERLGGTCNPVANACGQRCGTGARAMASLLQPNGPRRGCVPPRRRRHLPESWQPA